MIIFSEILLKYYEIYLVILSMLHILQRNKSNNTTNIGKITYRSDNISNENERINRKRLSYFYANV